MRKDSKDMVGVSKVFSSSSSSSSTCLGSGLSLFSLPENSHSVRNASYSHETCDQMSLLFLHISYTTKNVTFVKEKLSQ